MNRAVRSGRLDVLRQPEQIDVQHGVGRDKCRRHRDLDRGDARKGEPRPVPPACST